MMKKKDTYTVATLCYTYNQASYIEDALNGFAIQNTSFPVVFIIIDDASTDGEQGILRDWSNANLVCIKEAGCYTEEKPYGTVLFLRHKDKENSFFVLLLLSKNLYRRPDLKLSYIKEWYDDAKYFAFCEGDDYWTNPNKLQIQVDFLDNHKDYSASAHQSQCIGARSGYFYENVPQILTMNDVLSNARLFHTASIVYRASGYRDLPPMNMPIVSGDKLEILKLSYLGLIRYFEDCMGVYRVHSTGMSSVVKLKDIKKDRNIMVYMKSIYPQFPKYRFLSFLYGTFALYPKDVSIIQKVYYLFLSFVLSFSYFPTNIKDLAKKIRRHYHLKHLM